jgi:hypothetical protein
MRRCDPDIDDAASPDAATRAARGSEHAPPRDRARRSQACRRARAHRRHRSWHVRSRSCEMVVARDRRNARWPMAKLNSKRSAMRYAHLAGMADRAQHRSAARCRVAVSARPYPPTQRARQRSDRLVRAAPRQSELALHFALSRPVPVAPEAWVSPFDPFGTVAPAVVRSAMLQ